MMMRNLSRQIYCWYFVAVCAWSLSCHHVHGFQQQLKPQSRMSVSSLGVSSIVGGLGDGVNGNSNASSAPNPPPLRRNPPRKVYLMVEPTPFTHVSGYANRFKEMLKFLSKAGDDVEILTVDAKTPANKLPKSHSGFPISHTQGFTFPLYNHISLTVDLPEMKGAKIIEKFKPDLIHVTSPGFLLFAAMFYARCMCIPLVMSYHTHLPSYGKNYLGFVPGVESICWELLRYAHNRADLTLVTSPQMKEELVANGIPRVEVWRKGIDTERFQPKFRSMEMRIKMTDGNPDDFLMVYVGRLGAEKRLKDIKPMMEKLPANTRLCIVGKGPQEDELQRYFAGTNTVFTGQLSGDELSSAFASADVFVMPSDSETLGFVVLESMASGVPVIGAAAGGIPDLIHHERTGYLVEPGDIDDYVNRLSHLQQNGRARTRMGKAARKEAEKWGWEAATSYLRNVQYERALINFHSRAFGGFGRPRSGTMWKLLRWRMKRIQTKLLRVKEGTALGATVAMHTFGVKDGDDDDHDSGGVVSAPYNLSGVTSPPPRRPLFGLRKSVSAAYQSMKQRVKRSRTVSSLWSAVVGGRTA